MLLKNRNNQELAEIMSLISWDDSYSVGIKEIDDRHKQLIQHYNDLYDALGNGTAMNIMEDLVKNLQEFSDNHFATEEALFEKYQYPKRYEHIASHEEFTNKINKIASQISKDNYLLPIETIKFLRNWLLEHMQGEDQLYAKYFEKHPIDD